MNKSVKVFMFNKKLRILSILFSLFLANFLCAEDFFRVRKVVPFTISDSSSQEQTATIGINDSIAIFFPEDLTYIEGIEVKIQIPTEISSWQDSVACSIYDNIKPVPSSSQIDYSGSKIFITPLPSKFNWIMQIPLKQNNSIKDSPYTSKINVIPNIKKKYTFIRFQPAMKGIPESTLNANLKIGVKPILINKGSLNLSVFNNKNENIDYQLFIDDEQTDLAKTPLLLSTGMHNVSIQAEGYRSEVRSVYIEQAKSTSLEIILKSTTPTIIVTAPSNAEVFIDEEKFTDFGQETEISEGEHKIKCLIGGYELIRNVNIQKGKTYSINLSVNLEITDE